MQMISLANGKFLEMWTILENTEGQVAWLLS